MAVIIIKPLHRLFVWRSIYAYYVFYNKLHIHITAISSSVVKPYNFYMQLFPRLFKRALWISQKPSDSPSYCISSGGGEEEVRAVHIRNNRLRLNITRVPLL